MTKTFVIHSVNGYFERLRTEVGMSSDGNLAIYRGQRDESLPLLPGIARAPFDGKAAICTDPDCPNDTSAERRLLIMLREYGVTHFPAWVWHGTPEEVKWKQIIVAQHYRLPTRLLDWTTNPLAGLYFATEGLDAKCGKKCSYCRAGGKHDGAVFILRKCLTFSVTSLADKNKKPPLYAGPLDPGLLRAPEIDRRIGAQGSVFSIRKDPLEPIVPDLKFRIPVKRRPIILKELDDLGVNTRSLFPDLEGVARYLKWSVKFWEPNPGVKSP